MWSVVACGAFMAGTPARTAAQGNGGDPVPATECCLAYLLAIGARALALGDAVTARTSPGSLFANPAVVAGVTQDEFLVHNADTSLEDSNTFTLMIRTEVVGTIAVSFRLIDHGDQEATDPNQIPIGTISTYEQMLTATYATQVVAGLNAGISYKLYQFRQTCRGFTCEGISATTHGVDLGAQYRPTQWPALQLGASVVHLGFPLQFVNAGQASPMPLRIRGGGAYEVGHHLQSDSTVSVWLSLDAVLSPRDPGQSVVNVGAELSLDEMLFLWAGYGGGEGVLGGAAVGVGLFYDRFDVGIAKAFISSPIQDTEPLQITFGIRF
jgi:hypothetical protein